MYFLMSNKQKLGSYLKITVMKNDKKYIYIYPFSYLCMLQPQWWISSANTLLYYK